MKKIGSMKIRFENLEGVFTHIESFDLDEMKKYAEENNLTYVEGYTVKKNGKTCYVADYQKPEKK